MEKPSKFKIVLNEYVAGENSEMHLPWKSDEWVLACSGSECIRIKADLVPSVNRSMKAVSPDFPQRVSPTTVKVAELRQFIEKGEMGDEYNSKTCKECEGAGEVTWTYKNNEKEFDCPKCNGHGEHRWKTGQKHPIGFRLISAYGMTFKAGVLFRIVRIAEFLQLDEIRLETYPDRKFMIVDIGDFELMTMRCLNEGNHKVEVFLR